MHPETDTHGGTTCSRLSYGLTVGGGSSDWCIIPHQEDQDTQSDHELMFEHTSFEKTGNRMRWKSKREGKSWSKGQGKGFHGWHSFQQVVADKERHSKHRGQAGIGLYSGHWNHPETGVE